jgi:hypothetical protein
LELRPVFVVKLCGALIAFFVKHFSSLPLVLFFTVPQGLALPPFRSSAAAVPASQPPSPSPPPSHPLLILPTCLPTCLPFYLVHSNRL